MTEPEILESCGLRVEATGLPRPVVWALFVLVHLAGPAFWVLSWIMWHLGRRG